MMLNWDDSQQHRLTDIKLHLFADRDPSVLRRWLDLPLGETDWSQGRSDAALSNFPSLDGWKLTKKDGCWELTT
jgi:hypothetical protein